MPYYHDPQKEIVYSLPDEPGVTKKTHKGKPSGWTISGTLEITDANNVIDKETGNWTMPTSKAAIYPSNPKDSKEDSIREFFSRWRPHGSKDISADEYKKLRGEYERRSAGKK